MPDHYGKSKKAPQSKSIDLGGEIENVVQMIMNPSPVETQANNLVAGAAGAAAGAGMGAPAAGLNPNQIPGYANGGLVQPGGPTPPIDTGVAPGGPGLAAPGGAPAAPGGDMEAQAKQILQQNPQLIQQMVQSAQQAIASGEFTEQMIVQGGKMAIVVARNPEMYPKMYEELTSMGADDVPPQYDPEFVLTVIMMYLAWQQKDSVGAAAGPSQEEIPSFAQGGYVTQGSTGKDGEVKGPGGGTDDLLTVKLSNGEFVIPKDVVDRKGKDFFYKMINDSENQKRMA